MLVCLLELHIKLASQLACFAVTIQCAQIITLQAHLVHPSVMIWSFQSFGTVCQTIFCVKPLENSIIETSGSGSKKTGVVMKTLEIQTLPVIPTRWLMESSWQVFLEFSSLSTRQFRRTIKNVFVPLALVEYESWSRNLKYKDRHLWWFI